MREFKIGAHSIGERNPVFVVAELSANHLQKFDLARRTLEAMKQSGADAVKLQTYTPDTITLDVDNEYFKIKQGTIWDGKTLHQLYKEAYTPWEWHPKLMKLARDLGLECFSSPFDRTAVDFLESIGCPAYKVASLEITDIPLIEYIASKRKPIIISTGIAFLEDIQRALEACGRKSNDSLALLKCTSTYPTPLEEVNLDTIPDLKEKFGTVVGLSDHTLGVTVPIAATALGAKIVEKHFILERSLGGPDAKFSLEPDEFKKMVEAIREVEKALGHPTYELSEKLKRTREFARSLFVTKDINKGEAITDENVKSVRPGFGLHPRHLKEVLGKRAKTSITKGTPLSWDLIN